MLKTTKCTKDMNTCNNTSYIYDPLSNSHTMGMDMIFVCNLNNSKCVYSLSEIDLVLEGFNA